MRPTVVAGLMLATLLNFSAVLPRLNAYGRQSGSHYAESEARPVPFSDSYEVEATRSALTPLVRIEPECHASVDEGASTPPRWATWQRLRVKYKNQPLRAWQRLVQRERSNSHGSLWLDIDGCALFSLDKRDDESLRALWRIDAAFTWSPRIVAAADAVVRGLRQPSLGAGGAGELSALHMRIEDDWVEHCARWEDTLAEPPRNNCMTNTDALGNVFRTKAVPTALPVYVAIEEGQGDMELRRLRGLRTLPPQHVFLSKRMLAPELANGSREFLAAVDFAVGEHARFFIGNLVSTFSAMMLMRRSEADASAGAPCSHAHAGDFHYNDGAVPLAAVLFRKLLCPQHVAILTST